MNINKYLWTSLIVTVLCSAPLLTFGQQQTTAPEPREHYDIPVHIEAPIQPIPVKGVDGKWYLVYHLFVTNLAFSNLTLKKIEVSDALRKNVLTSYGENELTDTNRFLAFLPAPSTLRVSSMSDLRRLASGRTGLLFFWLTVDSAAAIPTSLKHRFVFEPNPLIKLSRGLSSDQEGGEMILDDYKVSVSNDKPVVIGAPLRGGDWGCDGGPAYNSFHQSTTTLGGKVRIAQRFACDFNKLDKEGNNRSNPTPGELTNKMFYAYGAEVLAVASGKVVFVRDGIPENVPQEKGFKPAVQMTRETNAGNWIALDLGNSRYALYAHLQPNSIRVKVGDKVRKGQVIALLGNSGNTTGPHLHFHIGNEYRILGGDFNGNEGLPFVFDSFVVGGQMRKMEMPIDDTVMQFK